MNNFKRAFLPQSELKDLESGLKNLSNQLGSPESKHTFLFVSPDVDCQKNGELFSEYFGSNLSAVTTAGEICGEGFVESSISGLSLHGNEFHAESFVFQDLSQVQDSLDAFQSVLETVREQERKLGDQAKTYAVLLIDGLSVKEENVTGLLGNLLGEMPLVGGSAGDALNFGHTYLWDQGKFIENAAQVVFVSTTVPFEIFKLQHFNETDKKLVITESEPSKRIVTEIDGEPAAEAYADLLGMQVSEFSPQTFSEYPVMLKIGEEYFVRSIQKVNDDNSLTFFCAIDDGLVLTLAERQDLYKRTQSFFEEVESRIGQVSCSLLFECILRRLEVLNKTEEEKKSINDLYNKYKAVGFHTYGEQFGSIHINQTLTGVVFGEPK